MIQGLTALLLEASFEGKVAFEEVLQEELMQAVESWQNLIRSCVYFRVPVEAASLEVEA